MFYSNINNLNIPSYNNMNQLSSNTPSVNNLGMNPYSNNIQCNNNNPYPYVDFCSINNNMNNYNNNISSNNIKRRPVSEATFKKYFRFNR